MKCKNCKIELGRPKLEERTQNDSRSSTVQLKTKNAKYVKVCPNCKRKNTIYILSTKRGYSRKMVYHLSPEGHK